MANKVHIRRLIVDDERFFPELSEADIDPLYARTSDAALFLLKHWTFEEIWLDHDLGGDDTARPVVMWLLEHYVADLPFHTDPKPKIMVHTQNPVGREYITSSLQKYFDVTQILL